MANVVKLQKLVDGPRNTIIKVVGILDTSDIAATGQIGSGGFTTSAGSRNVVFTAGALTPTIGQYVTFGDGTATFAAGTYITGITDATHITVNQAAKIDNAAAAVTITGSAGSVVLFDPVLLASMGIVEGLSNRVRISKIQYNLEDTLAAYLYWEATANDLIVPLEGRGKLEPLVPYNNTEAAGVTGKVLLATQGWAGGGVLSFALEISANKYQV